MLNLENLKQLRQEKGISQMKLAVLVGVSITAIRVWEQGGMKPNAEHLQKLEEILGGV